MAREPVYPSDRYQFRPPEQRVSGAELASRETPPSRLWKDLLFSNPRHDLARIAIGAVVIGVLAAFADGGYRRQMFAQAAAHAARGGAQRSREVQSGADRRKV